MSNFDAVQKTFHKTLKKIVLIEDDPVVAKVYQAKLERDGYNVVTAADGQEGFYQVYEGRPDAVILDLMLPKMDGLQMLKKFRAQKQFEKLPILVFTNEFASDLTREARAAGATDIFDKNKITPEDLLKALGRVFFNAAKADQAAIAEAQTVSLPVAGEADEMVKTFLANVPGTVNRLRETLVRLIRQKDPTALTTNLNDLLQTAHLIAGSAGAVGQKKIAQSSAALEAYVHDLLGKPDEINPSVIRTICQAVDFVCALLKDAKETPAVEESGLILIVDDEPLSRRAAKVSMDRAQLKSVCLSSPMTALQVLAENAFDLIILDVQMPEMDGFELCQRLRVLPGHKATPVVFVTSMSDFETRTKSTASGGNEFIAKPYMLMELALKAIISMKRAKPAGS